MSIFIVNDTIRVISFLLCLFIFIILRKSFYTQHMKQHAAKIYKAIEAGDEKTARELLHLIGKQLLKTQLFSEVNKRFEEKFNNTEK